jgi:hypothetical protein
MKKDVGPKYEGETDRLSIYDDLIAWIDNEVMEYMSLPEKEIKHVHLADRIIQRVVKVYSLDERTVKIPLTDKQQSIYDYYTGEGKYSLVKTANYFHKSLSTIHEHFQTIVRKGWLKNIRNGKPAYIKK